MNLFIITPQSGVGYSLTPPDWMRSNSLHLPDRHVVKMILESAQIVMTALHIKAVDQYHPGAAVMLTSTAVYSLPMALTNGHRKHPVIKWAADKRDTDMRHIAFVLLNAVMLCDEFRARYNKDHTYYHHLLALINTPEILTSRFELPEYLPLCAASAWDTKVTGNYIKTTQAGIDLIVALQRRNFILNKPWIATNYNRAAGVPPWVANAFHEDGYMRVAALDSITDMIRRNKQLIKFVPCDITSNV